MQELSTAAIYLPPSAEFIDREKKGPEQWQVSPPGLQSCTEPVALARAHADMLMSSGSSRALELSAAAGTVQLSSREKRRWGYRVVQGEEGVGRGETKGSSAQLLGSRAL